jgi:hypothetical protein
MRLALIQYTYMTVALSSYDGIGLCAHNLEAWRLTTMSVGCCRRSLSGLRWSLVLSPQFADQQPKRPTLVELFTHVTLTKGLGLAAVLERHFADMQPVVQSMLIAVPTAVHK